MQIPQMQPWLGDEEANAVAAAIRDNWITEGPRAAALSAQLNARIGTPYGVFAPNGTLALALGLLALGIGPGDEVLVPDITFIASASAVILAGATPVFVEVCADSYLIDPAACAALVGPRTRAVMPVHLFGMAADMEALSLLAQRHGLLIIEDAAQGIEVRLCGRHVGTFGDVGCFSFFADKTITMGEGGYIVCQAEAIYERLLLLRNQGRRDRGSFIHPALGFNFRITDLQAALGLAQLARLDAIMLRKRALLSRYQQLLAGITGLRLLPSDPEIHIPFRVVLFCDQAQDLMAYLEASGVQVRSFFFPLHRQPCFAHLDRSRGGPLDLDDRHYPNAITGYERGLLLPAYPTLSDEQVDWICLAVRRFFAGAGG